MNIDQSTYRQRERCLSLFCCMELVLSNFVDKMSDAQVQCILYPWKFLKWMWISIKQQSHGIPLCVDNKQVHINHYRRSGERIRTECANHGRPSVRTIRDCRTLQQTSIHNSYITASYECIWFSLYPRPMQQIYDNEKELLGKDFQEIIQSLRIL